MTGSFNRVVVLVDMDCFYVQVEQRRDPDRKGKPCAVVQYKTYQGGGIIAVGYEARAKGVTRGMWGDEAKALCPDIHLFRVPEAHGKANLDRYREAGAEVINVLSQFGGRVERASIDEAYIELTEVVNKIIEDQKQSEYMTLEKLPNTHIVGWTEAEEDMDKSETRSKGLQSWLKQTEPEPQNAGDIKLSIAAAITEEIREAVYHQTGFRCSAGISHNKMLSKLACGINKPNKQTILPRTSIDTLFASLKVGKIRHLGGKLGKSLVGNFGIEFIGEVGDIAVEKLVSAYGHKSAHWLHEVCQGIDHEPVKERHIAQSIGCGKNFLGPEALNTKEKVQKWMQALIIEISERLEKDRSANNRVARSLTVHARLETGQSLSRSGPLLKYNKEDLLGQCLGLIRTLDTRSSQDPVWYPAIISMSINAKKFDVIGGSINAMFLKTSPIKSASSADAVKLTFPTDNAVTPSQPSKRANVSDIFFRKGAKNGFNSPDNMIKIGLIKSERDHELSVSGGDQAGTSNNPSSPSTARTSHQSETSSMLVPVPSGSQDDVIFVSSKKTVSPRKPIKSFFNSVKETKTIATPPCLIDQVFLKEKEKAKEGLSSGDLPVEGSFSHPLFGEIDVDVFKTLPVDIKQEILKSHRITSSIISSSQPTKRQSTQNSKKSDRNQRMIFNFIPTTPTGSSFASKENAVTSAEKISMKCKRLHTDTSTGSSKKPKTQPRKISPKQKKAKTSTFSSRTKDDDVPLGFFRQRSQLNSAISKALTKQPRKWVNNQ